MEAAATDAGPRAQQQRQHNAAAFAGGKRYDVTASEAAHAGVALRALAPATEHSSTNTSRGLISTKKRKPTQVLRKEEKDELLKEIEELRLRIQALEMPIEVSANASQLAGARLENAIFHEAVRSQQLSLATTQSVVSGLLSGEHANPLSTCIRLGTDRAARRAHLLALKPSKIAHACAYVAARSRFVDPLQPHFADERFATARGDFIYAGYEVVQFTAGVQSVKQVYDVYVTYLLNLEISVSERLGYITVRDDFDCVEGSIMSYRFLTQEGDVAVETHGVLFLQFFESHELANGGPCGVVMIDCVDDDELYPYASSEAVRKDVTIAVVFTPHVVISEDSLDGEPEEKLVVTMTSGSFFRLHHSDQCELATPQAVDALRRNMTHWADEMLTTLHEMLHASSSGPAI